MRLAGISVGDEDVLELARELDEKIATVEAAIDGDEREIAELLTND